MTDYVSKVNLVTFTETSTCPLSIDYPYTSLIDNSSSFAYFPSCTSPTKISKVNISGGTEAASIIKTRKLDTSSKYW